MVCLILLYMNQHTDLNISTLCISCEGVAKSGSGVKSIGFYPFFDNNSIGKPGYVIELFWTSVSFYEKWRVTIYFLFTLQALYEDQTHFLSWEGLCSERQYGIMRMRSCYGIKLTPLLFGCVILLMSLTLNSPICKMGIMIVSTAWDCCGVICVKHLAQ